MRKKHCVFATVIVFMLFYTIMNMQDYIVGLYFDLFRIESQNKYYKFFKSSNHDISNEKHNFLSSDTIFESQWIETLHDKIDYGDSTCVGIKDGNPSKNTFFKILKQWESISKKYNIPYFLVYGSLIGAVRDSNFIPWDHDVDIMVDEANYEVIARLDNNRNFTATTIDENFHLVVQNFFRKDPNNLNRPRQNCMGKVSWKNENI